MRMPDVVVATLTRRSVVSAMQKGMGAALIVHFLRARVHPAVAAQVRSLVDTNSPHTYAAPPIHYILSCQGLGVPDNVVDQLHLWEQEQR